MSFNTIKIRDMVHVMDEFVANAAITPGHLVEIMSTGKVRKHSTANGNALKMFMYEDALQGKTIANACTAADNIQIWSPTSGDLVYGWLATGENVTRGTFLVSNGDGCLKAVEDSSSFGDDDSAKIIGIADEAVNAASADTRIKVRII